MNIVDWADAAITDPAVDFAGLGIWLGPSFVHEVLNVYTGSSDEGTFHRAMFLARAGLLGYLAENLDGGNSTPVPLLDAQLRAASAPPSSPRPCRRAPAHPGTQRRSN